MDKVYLFEKTIEYLNILAELQKKFDVRNPHHLTDVIFELKSKELIDAGVLTKIKIANIIAKYPAEFVMKHKGRSYPEEVKMVEEYPDRNKVLELILSKSLMK